MNPEDYSGGTSQAGHAESVGGHTPEPWSFSEGVGMLKGPDGRYIVGTTKNNRRIVACVNACAGLNDLEVSQLGTTLLEKTGRAMKAEQQRDELLALVNGFHRKLETYRNVYSGDKELHRLLSECEAAIAKAQP